MAPAGTPHDILLRLNAETSKAVQARDLREPLAAYAIEVIDSTPAELSAYLRNEVEKWAKVIKDANIRAD
jgi:tripartite-type tricarboxylate transporter receptor subunit TctC